MVESFLALVQLEIEDGLVEENSSRIEAYIERLNADLVAFPELSLSGKIDDRDRGFKLAEDCEKELDRLDEICREIGCLAVVGAPEARGNELYNSAFVLGLGKRVSYRKMHLISISPYRGISFREKEVFSRGNKPLVFETRAGKFGIEICYDLRFPELSRKLARMGAHAIINIGMFPRERIDHWVVLSRARAIENQIFFLSVNRAGANFGNTVAFDPAGNCLGELEEKEDVLTIRADVAREVEEARKLLFFLNDLNPYL